MSAHDYEPIVTVPTVHAAGALALYKVPYGSTIHLGLGDDIVTPSNTDLAPLAKAILNAVEPEALVENQKNAEPEPYKPGDWVKVADNAPYNDNFRGQTLQVSARNAFRKDRDWLTLSSEIGDGTVGTRWVTPASAPTPEPEYDIPSIIASLARLKGRVADLEAAAKDDEIKVGDRVYVRSDQWNISGVSAAYGTVRQIIRKNEFGKYLVSRDHVDTLGLGIWALDATKVN